jgi:Protein of unknown function (DUF3375)
VNAQGFVAGFAELKALREAPVWKLLGAAKAPAVGSLLQTLFLGGKERYLSSSALHERLTRHLEVLRSIGEDMPQTAQAYVQDWIAQGWLRRELPDGSLEEQFELTAGASEALRFLGRLLSPRTVATESRLATVIQLVSSLRDATDDDPEARVTTLLVERERIDRQIEDARSGRIVTLPADRAVERAREALGLVEEVTADFVKYAESFDLVYREFRKDLVESDGSRGEVLAKVFTGIDVIRESEPGQVFQAFWRLLLDPTESARFEEALNELVSRDFAEQLRPEERRALAYLKSSMMERAASVHAVQASFASGLQSFVRSREYTEQRRITRLLRQAQQAAIGVADDVRIGQKLEFSLLRTSAAIRSVSQWLLEDPANGAALGGMVAAEPDDVDVGTILGQIQRSEIDMRTLRRNLRSILTECSQASIAEVLGRYPAVQGLGSVVGYLHLAVRFGVEGAGREPIRWQGMDGAWRQGMAPLYYFTKERVHELAD